MAEVSVNVARQASASCIHFILNGRCEISGNHDGGSRRSRPARANSEIPSAIGSVSREIYGMVGPGPAVENYFLNCAQAALHYRCNLAARYLRRALENRATKSRRVRRARFARRGHVAVIKAPDRRKHGEPN